MSKRITNEEFIERSNKIHNYKYDYSKTVYTNKYGKVIIICPIHGDFEQIAESHYNGCGCIKCSERTMNKNIFIEKAIKIHGNRYDYSKVEYTGNNKTKLCIICKEHGEFWQSANSHLRTRGCLKCYKKNQVLDTEQFIKSAKEKHNDLYDYSKSVFIGSKKKVEIICSVHGSFFQTPNAHINHGQGCPKCKLKEQTALWNKLKNRFPSKNIINECCGIKWLKPQRIDIYFPDYKIAVEYNGPQHYMPINKYGGKIPFLKTQRRDEEKRRKCKNNNCSLFEMRYDYGDKEFEELCNQIQIIINESEFRNKW